MRGPSRATRAGGCAGEGLSKWLPKHLCSIALISQLISPAREEENWGGGVILQAGQGSGVCPSPVTPPPQHTEKFWGRSSNFLGCQTLSCGHSLPKCKTGFLPQAEPRGGKVESRNPGLTGARQDQGETPIRPRPGRGRPGPLVCQVGNSPVRKNAPRPGGDPRRLRPHAARPPFRPRSPGERSPASDPGGDPHRPLPAPRGRPGPLTGKTARRPSPLVQASASASPPPFPPPLPVSPPSPRATGGGGGGGDGRSGPSRGSPDLARCDVANQRGPELRAQPKT